MDRVIVYPGSIPLDTDFLSVNRNAMIALGYLMSVTLGTEPVVDGLACTPTNPASLAVSVGPGSITQQTALDAAAYGSLAADTSDSLLKMGINISSTVLTLAAPQTSGQAITYLVQASFLETDADPVALPYYNSVNPAQPFTGPGGSGTAQATRRTEAVQLEAKAGAPAAIGAQTAPPIDSGWVGLYTVTVAYGQIAVQASDISRLPGAPFVSFKLPDLRPGFGSGVASYNSSDSFTVPAGVTQVEVEVWGGGSGSFASVSGTPSGGGSGGGYARRRVTGLTPGQVVAVSVGAGGQGGVVGGQGASAGGTSSFGSYVSATGGQLNGNANTGSPIFGATPGGSGVGGDVNINGSAGQVGYGSNGGNGGAAPMGGSQNSGTTGNGGLFPGGGASGAGTSSGTAYDGAAGAGGYIVVRW